MRKLIGFGVFMIILVCGLAIYLNYGLFKLTHTTFSKHSETIQLEKKIDSLENKIIQLKDNLISVQENQILINEELNQVKQTIQNNHSIVERMRKSSQITYY